LGTTILSLCSPFQCGKQEIFLSPSSPCLYFILLYYNKSLLKFSPSERDRETPCCETPWNAFNVCGSYRLVFLCRNWEAVGDSSSILQWHERYVKLEYEGKFSMTTKIAPLQIQKTEFSVQLRDPFHRRVGICEVA
jgi:hypothetical protein